MATLIVKHFVRNPSLFTTPDFILQDVLMGTVFKQGVVVIYDFKQQKIKGNLGTNTTEKCELLQSFSR
jgi:D-arabinose 5-phosphate isomerase GutQ